MNKICDCSRKCWYWRAWLKLIPFKTSRKNETVSPKWRPSCHLLMLKCFPGDHQTASLPDLYVQDGLLFQPLHWRCKSHHWPGQSPPPEWLHFSSAFHTIISHKRYHRSLNCNIFWHRNLRHVEEISPTSFWELGPLKVVCSVRCHS